MEAKVYSKLNQANSLLSEGVPQDIADIGRIKRKQPDVLQSNIPSVNTVSAAESGVATPQVEFALKPRPVINLHS